MDANWLTAIGDHELKRLGDLGALKSEQGDIELIGYKGGQIIVAGCSPQLGEDTPNFCPAAFIRVNQALKPIRKKIHTGLHSCGANKMHEKEMTAWMSRFDNIKR